MNNYEHTFVTREDLPESQNKKTLEKYEGIINKNAGKVLKIQEWGLRSLTYKIKNNKKGFYFHIKFEGVGKTIDEIERVANIDDALLRYLTVKVKKHDLETNYFEKIENKYESKYEKK